MSPWGGAILNHTTIIGRIYIKRHITLVHLKKYTNFGPAFSEKKIFSYVSYYKPIAENDVPGAWPVWTPLGTVVGVI